MGTELKCRIVWTLFAGGLFVFFSVLVLGNEKRIESWNLALELSGCRRASVMGIVWIVVFCGSNFTGFGIARLDGNRPLLSGGINC